MMYIVSEMNENTNQMVNCTNRCFQCIQTLLRAFFFKNKKNAVIVYIGESGLIGEKNKRLLGSSSEWRKAGQSGYLLKSANKIASLKESTP